MSQINVLWLSVIASYIIQTKSFAHILGKNEILTESGTEIATKQKPSFTAQLSIIYLLSWLILVPFVDYIWSHNVPRSPLGEVGTDAAKIQDSQNNNNDEDGDISTPIALPEHNSQLSNLNRPSKSTFGGYVRYGFKILTMSICLVIIVLTYTLGLSLSPAFDVTLIQNTSFFEITTLLYGVSSVSKNKNVFVNFLIMMVALVSILIISYTNATCSLLAGKLSVNKETGEVDDPFLFDRLKAGLISGLGGLCVGPFAVCCNKWFETDCISEKNKMNKKNLVLIPIVSIILLLPLVPTNQTSEIVSEFLSDSKFWLSIITGIFLGTLPNIVSIIKLNARYPSEFVTTCNLGVIIVMGLVEWVCESGQTVIVRWEVIGYIFLSLCSITLYFRLRGP